MSLSDFLQPKVDQPPIITVVGDAGMLKTTLASKFPAPVFIRAEDGSASISDPNVGLMKPLQTGSEVFDQLTMLYKEEHNFQTVVIDSVTKLDAMFRKEVVDADPKAKSINTANGGYGAGFGAVAEMHWRVKRAADKLRNDRGMAIIFIAHSDTETIDPPDMDKYTRYSIRMHHTGVAPYSDDVDMVGYLHRQIFSKDGKPVDTGQIVFSAVGSASRISKNRFGIGEDILVDYNSPASVITKYIPYYNKAEK